jgi:hypothetical protein
MGLFVCDKCNCVENTALGWYWSKDIMRLVLPADMKEYEEGKSLCSECLPESGRFTDGGNPGFKGKWHGKFPKETIDVFMKGESGKYYKRYGNTLQYIGK